MKIANNSLDIFLASTDISKSVKTFGEEYSLTLLNSSHIDIGYKKPINQIFIEIKTPNIASSTISIQKWNGSAWVSLKHLDETNGFKKSGFIFFDEDDLTVKQLHNSKNQYWYRLIVNTSTSGLVLNGINLVFNNLADLKNEEPAIESFYPRTITSHILSIVSAREYILRRINNSQPLNFYILPTNPLTGLSYVDVRNLNVFDIFDINELRDASTYYALHKIFSNRSDEADSVYKQKADDYLLKFEQTFKLFTGRKLTIDINDDGIEDEGDKINSIKTIRLIR